MATIENYGSLDTALFDSMADEELVAQDLVQQGAIHAVSFLLEHGCNEATATDMLVSLRELAGRIRAEAAKRGKPLLFADDQMAAEQPSDAQCKACGGNDGDVPCAYPDGSHAACLRAQPSEDKLNAERYQAIRSSSTGKFRDGLETWLVGVGLDQFADEQVKLAAIAKGEGK